VSTAPILPGPARFPLERELVALAPRLRAVALRVVHDGDDADDVVQNAYEKAIRAVAGFRGDASLSTWMHRIVVNEALMWLRTRRRRMQRVVGPGPALDLALDPAPSPEDAAIHSKTGTRLQALLSELPATDREALLATLQEDTSARDRAARLSLEPAALKTRAHRARRRLAARFAEG
jgi:RNA polymerase sigma-70 factor (ECF subfamily)